MIKRLISFCIFLLLSVAIFAQDLCSSALPLCAGSSVSRTTELMTPSPGIDPPLNCGDNVVNNNVWFTVLAVNNGTCTVTVNNINNNPGLDMEVYTGTCGTLTPIPISPCASGSSATGGTMNVTFTTTTGTTYFIMVDGNGGNQEPFDIIATTSNNAIIARPNANFNTFPSSGCSPLLTTLDNDTSSLNGGPGVTYEWKIDAGSYAFTSGADSNVTFSTIGTHTVNLRVCNLQCGCKTVSQDVLVQDLFPVINYHPLGSCLGTNIFFDGTATIQPDPPHVDPGITSWDWNFGDPSSGVNNTANGQNVSHTFVGIATSYSVRLVVLGTCGPDTIYSTVNLLPKPVLTISAPGEICEGSAATLNSTLTNGNGIITYSWTGAGILSCTNCTSTTVTNLLAGGPYTFNLSMTDALGCTADTSADITVNATPTIFAGGFITVCHGATASLNAIASSGTPSYHYQWSPVLGLSNDTIANPTTTNTGGTSYCVAVTDSKGCLSNTDCVSISEYPQPVIVPGSANMCATQTNLQNTFIVSGSSPGSDYFWRLSPSYSFITSAAADSSTVTATFPATAGTYIFITIVLDSITGCLDTVPTAFTVDSGLSMNVTGPANICMGDSAILSISGATTYAWSASPVYAFADPTSSIQNVSPLVTANFTIIGTQGSCTQTIIYPLTVNAKPVTVINPIAPFCGCSSVALNGIGSSPGMSYLWSSQNGNIITSPSGLVTSVFICSDDSITLRVQETVSLCFTDTTVAATSRPKPDAQALVTPNIICNGISTPISLDGTGSSTDPGTSYDWSSNNIGAIISDTTALTTSTTVNTFTVFYLTVTDTSGCDSVASDTVLIYPPPILSASQPFLCTSDTSLHSTLTVSGASPGSTYLWTTIPGCVAPSSTTASSQNFDFATCGAAIYTFHVTVTDSITGCVNNLSQTVTVVNGVVLNVSGDTTFCEGGTAILTASGANTYLWNTTDSTDTVLVNGLTAGSSPYTFTVTGTIGSCTSSDTIRVTVDSVPSTSAITGPASVCANSAASVYSVTPAIGNYTWVVAGGTIVAGQGSNNLIVHWDSAGVGLVSVVDTNSFGCPGILQSLNIIINPLPDTPVVTGLANVCSDAIETYFVNAQAGYTYNWSLVNGVFTGLSSGTVLDFQWGTAGLGSINVYGVSAAGCAGPPATFNVNVNPRPLALNVIRDSTGCDNVPQVFYVIPNAGSTYTWTVSNASSTFISTLTDILTVNWAAPGVGAVDVFETNSFNCNSDTNHIPLLIYPHPQINIVQDSASVCNNTPYQIVASSNTANIVWHTDGSGTFSDTIAVSPVYNPAIADTGYIHLTMIASQNPCADETAQVTLYFSVSPTVTVTGPVAPICYGTSDSLTATGGGTYVWLPGGIPFQTIGIRPLITTTYTVAVTNSFNCTTFDSITVNVIPPGTPDAGPDLVLCISDTILLNGTQQNAGGILWSTLGDGTFLPDNTSSLISYSPGPGDTTAAFVRLVLVTTGACINLTDTVDISIQYLPSIIAGNDTTLNSGGGPDVVLPLAPVAVNVAGVVWTTSGTGSFVPSDTTLNATYVPSDEDFLSDSILITVTTTGSCNPVTDQLVIDFSPFVIPNVFTPYPASPGKNDFFFIRNLTSSTQLKVWDRWGNLVYSTLYYQNDWDANGLKSDVYYYLVVSDERKYKGWVQVMRDN